MTAKFEFSFGSRGEGDGQFLGGCYSLACSRDGSIVVGHSRGAQAFDIDGKFTRKIAPEALDEGCGGIAFDTNGEVFLSAFRGNCVIVTGQDGKVVRKLGSFGTADGRFDMPWGAAVDGKGLVIVADRDNGRVQQLRRDGGFVRSFSSHHGDVGKFLDPRGVALSADGSIFIVDRGCHCIVVCRLHLSTIIV